MKQRIYIDTSVFGGYFGEEFAEHTRPFFNRINEGDFIILYSTVTQEELEKAPVRVKQLVTNLQVNQTEFIEITEEAIDLATAYITENVVGKTSYADCLHIALATINHSDFLVSWNFKHIVNIERIRGYNYINIKKATNNQIFDHQENLKNMKTTEKTFDAVKFMRNQRDKLSEKLSKMTKEEILEYFRNRKNQTTIKPSA